MAHGVYCIYEHF